VFTLAAAAVGQTKITLGQVNAPVAALGPDNTSELDRRRSSTWSTTRSNRAPAPSS